MGYKQEPLISREPLISNSLTALPCGDHGCRPGAYDGITTTCLRWGKTHLLLSNQTGCVSHGNQDSVGAIIPPGRALPPGRWSSARLPQSAPAPGQEPDRASAIGLVQLSRLSFKSQGLSCPLNLAGFHSLRTELHFSCICTSHAKVHRTKKQKRTCKRCVSMCLHTTWQFYYPLSTGAAHIPASHSHIHHHISPIENLVMTELIDNRHLFIIT